MMDEQKIINILNSVLEERSKMDSEMHTDDHAWIRAKIEQEEARKKFFEELTKTVLQWSIPFLLTGLVVYWQTGSWPKL